MSQSYRLSNEGLLNRNKVISFKFNGKKYTGYEGDTLASALLANGIHLVGRSFKYHRPRGFFGAGVDEPNAKLQIQLNGHSEPNVNATEFELVEGKWEHPRTIVIKFPSYEKAQEWYKSEEYKPIKKIRLDNALSNGIIIKGE